VLLSDFSVDPAGLVCLDVGAGRGLHRLLLQHGASRVYAVDVNVDQRPGSAARSSCSSHRTHARSFGRKIYPNPSTFAVADVSFISVTKVLRPTAVILNPGGHHAALVKPQIPSCLPRTSEKGGIVADTALHEKAITACAVPPSKLVSRF